MGKNGMNRITIKKISITELDTDAIVNAANSGLLAGGGVCGAIFRAAGYDELQAACDRIGHCDTGSAVITPGFRLKAKYIIHAVGPIWNGGTDGEPELLYSAYRKSLNLVMENGCHSIGFPLISAGIYGYPVQKAWEQALRACMDFIEKNKDYGIDIVFAVLSDDIINIGNEILKKNRQVDKKMAEKLYIGNREEEAYFFYRPNEPYGCFSNWYKSPFTVNGIRFNTAEQYIMYQKCIIFGDKEAAADMLAANSPREQKAIGRRARGYIHKVWEGIRQMVAVKGLYAKFSQNEDLKKILLATGNAYIVETTENDRIWACGLSLDDNNRFYADRWHGQNILGFALMEVRDILKREHYIL